MKQGIKSHLDTSIVNSFDETDAMDVEVQAEDNSGQTPLHRAVIDNNLEDVMDFVAAGVELNTYDNYGFLPLDYASNSDIKEFLLKSGASLPDSPRQLHSLALNNDVEAIHQLLETDSTDLNALDTKGATPLHYAIQTGHLDAVIALAQKGANLAQVDKAGYPPIFYANDEIKQFLLDCGASEFDPNTWFDLSNNALHDAATYDDLDEGVRILAENPALINSANRSNETPLMSAINNQHLAMVDLLLNHRANTEITDINGDTPLLRAVSLGNHEMVDLLLEHGADPEVLNSQMGIIERAKIDGKHSPLSKYLKKRTGVSEASLQIIQSSFEQLLIKELTHAREQNKMPLIVLGELHGHFKIYQVEKVMLQVAKKYGFNTVYVEKPELNHSIFDIDRKAKNALNMTLVPVDTHPSREIASKEERNRYISAEISAKNKPGILITGADHLKGLLQDKETKIDTNKFYLIPINLHRISKSPFDVCSETTFARNPFNVIQILNERYFTSTSQVNAQWNNQPAKLNAFGRPRIKRSKNHAFRARKQMNSNTKKNSVEYPEFGQLLLMLLEFLANYFKVTIPSNRFSKAGVEQNSSDESINDKDFGNDVCDIVEDYMPSPSYTPVMRARSAHRPSSAAQAAIYSSLNKSSRR